MGLVLEAAGDAVLQLLVDVDAGEGRAGGGVADPGLDDRFEAAGGAEGEAQAGVEVVELGVIGVQQRVVQLEAGVQAGDAEVACS